MVSKKKKPVNRKRRAAALKGWETRRKNAEAKARLDIDSSVTKRLKKELEEAKAKLRETQKALAKEKRKGRVIVAGSAKEVLESLPRKDRKKAKRDYIQKRMDFALRVYGEVFSMALDLAEELDVDTSDIFDDWDYDPDS